MGDNIRCPLSFYAGREGNGDLPEREGSAALYPDRLILASGGEESIDYLDILNIDCRDYRIYLTLAGGQSRELFYLGHQYEMFVRSLYRYWNEAVIKALLMQEKQLEVFPDAVFHYSRDGRVASSGDCELRLYETALVIVPKTAGILRIPYSFLANRQLENYQITIRTHLDETLVITQMGFLFDPFMTKLNQAIEELSGKMRDLLKGLFPDRPEAEIRMLSDRMKDGKAVLRRDLEEVSENLWGQIETLLAQMGIGESYRFLAGLNAGFGELHPEAVGLKRGLMGDMTGVYVFLLIPIIPYKALVLEAAGAEGGKATYFFRLKERGQSLLSLRRQLLELNYSLLAVNFRREPIYLSEEQLCAEEYRRYRYAAANIPELQSLRMSYLGRVMHTDKWEEQAATLLNKIKTQG